MEKTRRFPWMPVLVGGCCLVFVCLCCIVAGSAGCYLYTNNELPSQFTIQIPFEETAEAESTRVLPTNVSAIVAPTRAESVTPTTTLEPEPMIEPAEENPLDEEPPGVVLTGEQKREDYYMFDDFSSEAMDWSLDKDEYVNLSIIDGAYNIHVLQPDDLEYIYFPVDFISYEIAFDIKGPSGDQDGTFGVYCHHLDEDNTYYIEFDLSTKSYVITEEKDSELYPLTEENSAGQYWQPIKSLKSPPTSTNHIAISCYLDSITLFVNDTLIDQVAVSDPLPDTGEGAIYVYAFPFADKNGYEITIDNVEIFQPVQ